LSILKDCVSTWTPTFLIDAYQLDSVTSILFGTLMPVFGLLGPYMANWIMHKVNDEFSSMFWLLIISSGALALLVLAGRYSLGIAVFCLALTYACSLGQNMLLIGTIPMYFLNVGRVAGVTGVLNASAYFSAAMMSLLTGILVDHLGWTFTITVWMMLSIVGSMFCIISRRKWKKFRRNLF
jgi:sugar phosphate permease